ncbi:unnamed protein product, partial [Didymodactylos carnosus]
ANGFIFHNLLDTILCKIITYLLSCLTRMSYWLTSFITIERVYVTKYPTGQWFKKPIIAKRVIIITVLGVLAAHIYEPIYYHIVSDPKYTEFGTWCVSHYSSFWSIYNQITVFIHYVIPFLINFISTFILIILIAQNRSSAMQNQTKLKLVKKYFYEHKDRFIPSITIILSSLPQLIISFSLACTGLTTSWLRYPLIVAYFLSYTPQIIGYFLYVVSSQFYRSKLYETKLGKMLKPRETRENLESSVVAKNTAKSEI